MSTFSELQDRRQQILKITNEHGINNIKVFGSVAQFEDSKNSDVDLIVSFDKGRSLFDLINFKKEMSLLLDRHVDVVTENSLNKFIKDDILQEAIELFGE